MTYIAQISSYGLVDVTAKIKATHTDFVHANDSGILSFMETFSFPNLKKMTVSLKKAKYSTEEIKEIISGLKTLPEYKRG